MEQPVRRSIHPSVKEEGMTHFDMEILVGYILLLGVLLSMALLIIGLTWHWAMTGDLRMEYPIVGMNLFEFMHAAVRQISSGSIHPPLMVNLGIAVVMFTPYVRVVASMLYFAWVEHNLKYALFTGFVLSVLTYSLFLR
jgi:uncharacterized membrane protein